MNLSVREAELYFEGMTLLKQGLNDEEIREFIELISVKGELNDLKDSFS